MRRISIVITAITIFFTSYSSIFASSREDGLGCGGGLGPIGEFFCSVRSAAEVGEKFNTVISAIIGFLTIMAALWFGWQLLSAGFQWIGSGGDKAATEGARNKITYGLLGLIVIVISWVLLGLIGKIVGIDILDPGAVIQNLHL